MCAQQLSERELTLNLNISDLTHQEGGVRTRRASIALPSWKAQPTERELYLSRNKDVKRGAHNNVFRGVQTLPTSHSQLTFRPGEEMDFDALLPQAIREQSIQTFNNNPQEGIAQFMSEGFSLKAIAKVLHNPAISKVTLGEFLSSREEFPSQLLGEFLALLNFANMDFDLALRRFLYCLKLPGEAQKIDRLMRQFASQYFKANRAQNNFKNELAVYCVSFGSIMLNTDAHNDNVKNKMTERQFLDNIYHTAGGAEVPAAFLQDLYFRIVSEEIQLEKEKALYPNATKKGFLYLHNKSFGNSWKKRWVILSDNYIMICKKSGDPVPIVGIMLDNCFIAITSDKEKGRKFCIRLHLPPSVKGTSVSRAAFTSHLLLSADSPDDLFQWARSIESKLSPENRDCVYL